MLARREKFGLSQLDLGVLGGPSNSTLTQIESARGPVPSASTLKKLDRALGWPPGTARRLLTPAMSDSEAEHWIDSQPPDMNWLNKIDDLSNRGGGPGVVIPPTPDQFMLGPGVPDEPSTAEDRFEAARIGFHQAIHEFAKAEALLDGVMRRLAVQELMREPFAAAVRQEEATQGRALGFSERAALLDELERPSADEIAEWTAWNAAHDPTREWTRYEMALVEYVFPDYPRDPRAGSAYADLEPQRERVRRLGPRRDGELIRDETNAVADPWDPPEPGEPDDFDFRTPLAYEPVAARKDPRGQRTKGQRARDQADRAGEESQDPGDEIEPR